MSVICWPVGFISFHFRLLPTRQRLLSSWLSVLAAAFRPFSLFSHSIDAYGYLESPFDICIVMFRVGSFGVPLF